MTERRIQLTLSAVLLLVTAWYMVQMLSYPANAGRVPAIVALVTAGALVLQIVGQVRGLRRPEPAPAPASTVTANLPDHDPLARAEERVHEVDSALSGYDTLLEFDRVRRNRFIAIAAFSVLFYVGALLVGFVLTTAVLIPVFLLVARERVMTAIAAGVVSAAAVYALVVVVIGLRPLDGYFF
jgi:hypothetical protein